ncbi:hypothetical protein CgunFtcFv8_011460 [Champsocephalus gunnari]|uniref:Uncharacterized protein n=1 Tax=Champsocephalus gunnari TaxID=52237 RepID=A0AAN8DEW8_CHAGU|nr:hypothetical protein CgunFtcFv8_011460 [Champsocephalus gunnari]
MRTVSTGEERGNGWSAGCSTSDSDTSAHSTANRSMLITESSRDAVQMRRCSSRAPPQKAPRSAAAGGGALLGCRHRETCWLCI